MSLIKQLLQGFKLLVNPHVEPSWLSTTQTARSWAMVTTCLNLYLLCCASHSCGTCSEQSIILNTKLWLFIGVIFIVVIQCPCMYQSVMRNCLFLIDAVIIFITDVYIHLFDGIMSWWQILVNRCDLCPDKDQVWTREACRLPLWHKQYPYICRAKCLLYVICMTKQSIKEFGSMHLSAKGFGLVLVFHAGSMMYRSDPACNHDT